MIIVDKDSDLDIFVLYYLFISRPSSPNGGWPTTKQTRILTPIIPSAPLSFKDKNPMTHLGQGPHIRYRAQQPKLVYPRTIIDVTQNTWPAAHAV